MGTDGDVLGERIGAYLLDQFVMFVPGAGLIGLGFILMAAAPDHPVGTVGVVGFLAGIVFLPVFGFVYKIGLEAIYGATLGKRLVGIVVVTEDGESCGWTESLIRNILYFLVDSGVIALLIMLITDDHQRIGDLLAHTVVVREA